MAYLTAVARRDTLILFIALCALSPAIAAPAGAQAAPAGPAAAPAPTRPAGQPSKTWEKSLVQALKPTPAGVKYQLNVSESAIEAETMQEFVTKYAEASRNMVELRSGRSPGSYQWSLSTPWQQETHLGRCQFKDIDVRITYDVDIVTLGGPVAQDSSARARWERQTDQLYANHFERLRLLRDSSRALYQRLRLMSNSSCGELANIANQATREARFEINDNMRALGGRTVPIDDR